MYHSYNNQAVPIFSAYFLSTQLTLQFPYPCISPSRSPLPSLSPSALGSIGFLLRFCYGKIPKNPDRPLRCLLMPGLANAAGASPRARFREGPSFKSPKNAPAAGACTFTTTATNTKLNYHRYAHSCSLYC